MRTGRTYKSGKGVQEQGRNACHVSKRSLAVRDVAARLVLFVVGFCADVCGWEGFGPGTLVIQRPGNQMDHGVAVSASGNFFCQMRKQAAEKNLRGGRSCYEELACYAFGSRFD